MGIKLSEWKLKMSGNVDSYLAKLSGGGDKASAKFAKLQDNLSLSSNKFQAISQEVPVLNRGMQFMSSGAMLAGAGIALVGTGLVKSTQLAMDYEKGMAKINATAQLTKPELALLKNELMEVGENSAGNFERIPDAFEKINSQVNDTRKSLQILKIANKGAQAGFVDIDLAAGALAQTLSIVGNKSNATEVMDTLLKAKAVGAGEFGDFANYLPQLIASGSNLNIAFKDTAGLFAFMTAKGQSAADSAMLMQNAFTAMGKSDIQKGFAKAGINLFNKDGTMRDLDVFFGELSHKLEGMSAQTKSNFLEGIGLKDAQAKNAFAILAGDAKKLKSVMDDVRHSTGELNKQLDVTENKSRSWSQIGDEMKSWGVSLGDSLLPVIDHIVMALEGVGSGIKGLFSKAKWQGFEEPEQLESKKKMAIKTATEQADISFKEKFGYDVGDQSKKATLESNVFYQSKYNQLYKALMGEEYTRQYQTKEKVDLTKDVFGNKKTKSKLKDGIDGINDGGRHIRNINVTIHKMVEGGINIHSATVKEGAAEMSKDLEDYLLRAINGAELSLTNE